MAVLENPGSWRVCFTVLQKIVAGPRWGHPFCVLLKQHFYFRSLVNNSGGSILLKDSRLWSVGKTNKHAFLSRRYLIWPAFMRALKLPILSLIHKTRNSKVMYWLLSLLPSHRAVDRLSVRQPRWSLPGFRPGQHPDWIPEVETGRSPAAAEIRRRRCSFRLNPGCRRPDRKKVSMKFPLTVEST